MHHFARGNKANKLGPRYPYFLTDAYNQRTFRREVAIEVKVLGGPAPRNHQVKRKFERLAIRVADSAWWKMKLPRQVRKLLRQWQADECRHIDEQMLRNAI